MKIRMIKKLAKKYGFSLIGVGKEIIDDMKKWDCKPLDRRNYERFRKVALALYHKQSLVDFSDFTGKQNYMVRQIWGD